MGLLLVWLAPGCGTVATGEVRDPSGAAVAGVTVHADALSPCDAVTDAAGAWRARCPEGSYTFTLRHPAFLPRELSVEIAGSGEVAIPPFQLEPIPVEGGVYLLAGGRLVRPDPAPLARKGSETEGWRWCTGEGIPVEIPAGKLRMLDNHVTAWRLFRLDQEGCAYRLRRTAGDYWDYTAEPFELKRVEELGPGREWLEVELAPGRYLLADWLAGGFVPEGEGWRAGWFEVGE